MDEKVKKGMFILLFLIILISVIGTLTFLDSLNNLADTSEAPQVREGDNTANAQVTLIIEEPPISTATGHNPVGPCRIRGRSPTGSRGRTRIVPWGRASQVEPMPVALS